MDSFKWLHTINPGFTYVFPDAASGLDAILNCDKILKPIASAVLCKGGILSSRHLPVSTDNGGAFDDMDHKILKKLFHD